MALEIVDKGHNNIVDIEGREQFHGRITFNGSNSCVKISNPTSAANLSLVMGSDSQVTIGEKSRLKGVAIIMAHETSLTIGQALASPSDLWFYLHEPSHITIGDHCLLAGGVRFTTSDMHAIYDVKSGKRTNLARNITIGDRVWLASECLVLKGTQVGNFSAVGARSVVMGRIPPFCIAAGNPARVVREGVTWSGVLHDELPGEIAAEAAIFMAAAMGCQTSTDG